MKRKHLQYFYLHYGLQRKAQILHEFQNFLFFGQAKQHLMIIQYVYNQKTYAKIVLSL